MNYDYKIVNTDPNALFMKRALLYLAMLLAIVAVALFVLLILFERYLSLFISAGLLLDSVLIWIIVGRTSVAFYYHYSEKSLRVEGKKGDTLSLMLSEIKIIKNAEKSDFFNESIIKYTYINGRIIMKNSLNENMPKTESVVVECGSDRYLLGLDEYAAALLGGKND